MTIEEKAKAYDEALEIAKGLYAKDAPDSLHLERMFPELRESEDERIRKAIIKMIADIAGGFPFEKYGILKKEALAWLEKQGEKDELIKELSKYTAKYIREVVCKYPEKQGEQTSSWSEDDQSNFNELGSFILETYRAEDASRLITWLNDIKDRVLPQPK